MDEDAISLGMDEEMAFESDEEEPPSDSELSEFGEDPWLALTKKLGNRRKKSKMESSESEDDDHFSSKLASSQDRAVYFQSLPAIEEVSASPSTVMTSSDPHNLIITTGQQTGPDSKKARRVTRSSKKKPTTNEPPPIPLVGRQKRKTGASSDEGANPPKKALKTVSNSKPAQGRINKPVLPLDFSAKVKSPVQSTLVKPITEGSTYEITNETLEILDGPDGHADPRIQQELKRWVNDDWEMLSGSPAGLTIKHYIKALPFRMSNTLAIEKISRAYVHLNTLNLLYSSHSTHPLRSDQLNFLKNTCNSYQATSVSSKLVNQIDNFVNKLSEYLDRLKDNAEILVAESQRQFTMNNALYEQVFNSISTKMAQLSTMLDKSGLGGDDKTGAIMLGRTTPVIPRAPSLASISRSISSSSLPSISSAPSTQTQPSATRFPKFTFSSQP